MVSNARALRASMDSIATRDSRFVDFIGQTPTFNNEIFDENDKTSNSQLWMTTFEMCCGGTARDIVLEKKHDGLGALALLYQTYVASTGRVQARALEQQIANLSQERDCKGDVHLTAMTIKCLCNDYADLTGKPFDNNYVVDLLTLALDLDTE